MSPTNFVLRAFSISRLICNEIFCSSGILHYFFLIIFCFEKIYSPPQIMTISFLQILTTYLPIGPDIYIDDETSRSIVQTYKRTHTTHEYL